MMDRLVQLYKKTGGGHTKLSDNDFKEYAELRKMEFINRKNELLKLGMRDVTACKDDMGDIIGVTFIMDRNEQLIP